MLPFHMGYLVKIQKVDRPTNRSFYVNLPVVMAEALAIEKGEQFQWTVEDKNTLVLARVKPLKSRRLASRP
jgi:hypothetical protein